MLDVGAEAAEARGDRLAVLGMGADGARQRQQRQSALEIDAFEIEALRDRGALRLLLAILAKLHVGPEAATAKGDIEAGLGIGAEQLAFVAEGGLVAALGELPGEAAVGIVGAADEGAELSDLEAEAAFATGRAGARIAAFVRCREDVGPEHVVQRIEHLGDTEVADILHRGDEVAPEVAEHVLPLQLAGGDQVELLLEVGREVIFDVAAEEILEERGDEAPLVLRVQAASCRAGHIRGRARC